MAVVKIPDENRVFHEVEEIRKFLAGIGIAYERWETRDPHLAEASQEQVLAACGKQIDRLRAEGGYVTADVIDVSRVPRGTRHWFDLCSEKRIRAIRLFQDASGWTPHYTNSAVDRNYEPVCFGPRYIPQQPGSATP